MSEHSEALQDATAQLYIAFSAYEANTVDALRENHLLENDNLTTTALNQLSVSDLTPYIQNFGKLEDVGESLRYLLPRILELCIDGYHRWSMSLESIFGLLNDANWQSWSEVEKRSIENFLRALWLHHLNDVSPTGTTSSADTLLEAIATIMEIQPFLDVWLDVPEKSATAHIASLTVYGKKRLTDIHRWLAQPHILQRIEAAFWDCNDSSRAAMFAKAAEYLRLDNTFVPA